MDRWTQKHDLEPDVLMTGEEQYPVLGDILIKEIIEKHITPKFRGLQLYGDCLKKSVVMFKYLKEKMHIEHVYVLMGAMYVSSVPDPATGEVSRYGFAMNPPNEFHTWVYLLPSRAVIDCALPGVIMRGKRMRDERGFFLEGREPVILAGVVPEWLYYHPVLEVQAVELT